MIGGTPKSRRPARQSGKPFSNTTIVNINANGPVKATHKPKNFDFSPNALKHISERLSGILKKSSESTKKRTSSKNNTPRNGEMAKPRQVPKSAAHKRRGSLAEPRKLPHTRKFSTESLPMIAKFAHRTLQGVIPGNPEKVNQDAYFECPNLGPLSDIYMFGVCDGHGLYGHFVSAFVKQRLPMLMAQDPKLNLDVKKVLSSSIVRCNEELKSINLDTNFSGTTLIVVVIKGKRLWCANVGDSRAVLGRQLSDSSGRHWMAVALSRDHKPDLPEESARIQASGGRVESYFDEDGAPAGPARVWLKHEDTPGLAMSRSLGDNVAASVGVIPIPEILELQLTSADKFIVMGSDGVFEFISNEEAVKMVIPYWKMQDTDGGLELLERESVARWRQEEEVIDDITSLCIFLDLN